MIFISGPQGSGKTTELIKMAAEGNGRIVCYDHREARRIVGAADAMGYKIHYPLTYSEFMDGAFIKKNISGFYVDDVEALLHHMSRGAAVKAVTVDIKERGGQQHRPPSPDMVEVKDLKRAEIVYECEYGENNELVVLEDPWYYEEEKGWRCRVWDAKATERGSWGTGKIVNLFQSSDYPHYGPKLYRTPQYGKGAVKHSAGRGGVSSVGYPGDVPTSTHETNDTSNQQVPGFTINFPLAAEEQFQAARKLMDWVKRENDEERPKPIHVRDLVEGEVVYEVNRHAVKELVVLSAPYRHRSDDGWGCRVKDRGLDMEVLLLQSDSKPSTEPPLLYRTLPDDMSFEDLINSTRGSEDAKDE